MANRRRNVGLALALAVSLLASPVLANPGQPEQATDRRAEIRAALSSVGAYVANVLVTPSGFARSDYDLMEGRWRDYEPHWHAGQQILGLLHAHRLTGEPRLLRAATRAGRWWVGTEFKPPHRLVGLVNAAHGDHIGHLINFTTISDGTPGLFALTAVTGDRRYADTASRSGAWLWANMQVPASIPGGEGLFYNFVDPETGTILTDRSPTHPGVTNPTITQTARPNIEGSLFKDMCQHTGDQVWCGRFIEQARFAMARQDANGLWMAFEPNNPATGDVHPRFNIWNAEAMMEAWALTGDQAFLEAAARTGRFMASVQRPDGAIYYNLKSDGTFRRDSITGSATAFAGILWLRLRDAGVGGFDANIERSVNWVLANRFPTNHPDPNLRGAVLETRVRVVDGETRIAIRDIASAFGLRFLAMAHDDLSGADVNQMVFTRVTR